MGTVSNIDASQQKLTLKTEKGEEWSIKTATDTRMVRMAPGQTDLKSGTPIQFSDITNGDRVLARGAAGEGDKAINANLVVVMSKADLQKKQETEQAAWNKGIFGVVKSADPATKIVVVTEKQMLRGGAGKDVTVDLKAATLKRYVADSVKYDDAKPAELSAVQPGDQIRVRGTADGDNFKGDAAVFGTFKNLAIQVVSVDAATGVVKATNLDTKKPMEVVAAPDATLRKLPAMMAQFLAMRLSGAISGGPNGGNGAGAPAGRPAMAGGGRPGAEGAPGAPGGRPMGGPGGGPGGPGGGAMLDRIPPFKMTELKAGDALIVLTSSTDPTKVTAISALAGVEPLLTAPQSRQALMGGWNLDMSNIGGGLMQ